MFDFNKSNTLFIVIKILDLTKVRSMGRVKVGKLWYNCEKF